MQPQEIATVETGGLVRAPVEVKAALPSNDCCFGEVFCRMAATGDSPHFLASSSPNRSQRRTTAGTFRRTRKVKKFAGLRLVLRWRRADRNTAGQWVLFPSRTTPASYLFGKLFSKPDLSVLETLRARIRRELETKDGIQDCVGRLAKRRKRTAAPLLRSLLSGNWDAPFTANAANRRRLVNHPDAARHLAGAQLLGKAVEFLSDGWLGEKMKDNQRGCSTARNCRARPSSGPGRRIVAGITEECPVPVAPSGPAGLRHSPWRRPPGGACAGSSAGV